MNNLTTATYTFLFTDIEASTRAWAEQPAAMPGIIERHDRLMDGVVGRHGGTVFKRVGDVVQQRDADLGRACSRPATVGRYS